MGKEQNIPETTLCCHQRFSFWHTPKVGKIRFCHNLGMPETDLLQTKNEFGDHFTIDVFAKLHQDHQKGFLRIVSTNQRLAYSPLDLKLAPAPAEMPCEKHFYQSAFNCQTEIQSIIIILRAYQPYGALWGISALWGLTRHGHSQPNHKAEHKLVEVTTDTISSNSSCLLSPFRDTNVYLQTTFYVGAVQGVDLIGLLSH